MTLVPKPPAPHQFPAIAWERCFRAVVDATESKLLEHEHLRLHERLIAAETETLKGVLTGDQEYKLTGFVRDFLGFAAGLLEYIGEIVLVYSYERRSGLRSDQCHNDMYYGFVIKDLHTPDIIPLRDNSLDIKEGVPVFLLKSLADHLAGCNLLQCYILHEREGVFDPDYHIGTYDSGLPLTVLHDLTDHCYQWALYGYTLKTEYDFLLTSIDFQTALRACFLFHITVWNSYLKAAHDRAVKIGRTLAPLKKELGRLATYIEDQALQHTGATDRSLPMPVVSVKDALDRFTREIESQALGQKSALGHVLPMPDVVYEDSPFFGAATRWKLLHNGPQTVGEMRSIHHWLESQRTSAANLWEFYTLCGGPQFDETLNAERLSNSDFLNGKLLRQAHNLYSAMKLLTRRLYVLPPQFGGHNNLRFDGHFYSLCLDQILLALLYGLDLGRVACQVLLRCHRTDPLLGGCVYGCPRKLDEYCFSCTKNDQKGRLASFVLGSEWIRYSDVKPQYAVQLFDPREDWITTNVTADGRFDEMLWALRNAAEVGYILNLKEIGLDWYAPRAGEESAKLSIVFRYGQKLARDPKQTGTAFRATQTLLSMRPAEKAGSTTATCDLDEIDEAETHMGVTLWSLSEDEFHKLHNGANR